MTPAWYAVSKTSPIHMLLSSDEFHAALAHIASLDISYSVEMGLRIGLNKALVAFPSILFPFLGKVVAVSEGALSEVTKIFPDKLVRSATPAFSAPLVVSEALDQAPVDHATDGLPPIV
ncbi:hypothetical protein Tco_0445404 [Tanacetum coccineum]